MPRVLDFNHPAAEFLMKLCLNKSLVRSLTSSCVCSHVGPFIPGCLHVFTSFARSLVRSFVRLFVRTLVGWFIPGRLFIRSLVRSFVHSRARSLVREFIYSLTRYFVHKNILSTFLRAKKRTSRLDYQPLFGKKPAFLCS